jgi:hypothetical protein
MFSNLEVGIGLLALNPTPAAGAMHVRVNTHVLGPYDLLANCASAAGAMHVRVNAHLLGLDDLLANCARTARTVVKRTYTLHAVLLQLDF